METQPYFHARSFAEVVEEGARAKARRKIIGPFLYEDTNTYLFSRTNTGKSLLAFHVGYCAATGTSFQSCPALVNDSDPMKVLIADLEMDPQTIHERHGPAISAANHLLLENLTYIHENPGAKPIFSFELLEKIEQAAFDHKAKLIILDNISKIMPDLLNANDVAKVIEFMKRIRQNIGASFLVIGHTTKSDIRTAITPQSYYGSAMLQNFFSEIFFLDATNDGRFYLSHAKTKRLESYIETVPVFTRGAHPLVGTGFTFESLQPLPEVQLPLTIVPAPKSRKINLADFKQEIAILDQAGIRRSRIADIFNVSRSAVSHIFEP